MPVLETLFMTLFVCRWDSFHIQFMFLGFDALAIWQNWRLQLSRSFHGLLFHFRFSFYLVGLVFWKQSLCTEDFWEFHYLTESRFYFFGHLYYTLHLYVGPDGSGDAEASPSNVIFLHKGTNLIAEAKWRNAPIVLWVRHPAKCVEMGCSPRLCTGPWVHTPCTAAWRYIQVPWGKLVDLYLYLVIFLT